MKNLFANKLGITVDTVNTNKHSDVLSVFRPVTKEEGELMHKWIEEVYTDFIGKVGQGREMLPAQVDSIGQGRVWSGIDGKRIGLVDEWGGIKDAIALAAKKAEVTEYKIVDLPKQKDPFEEIMNDLFDQDEIIEKKLKQEFGSSYDNYQRMKNSLKYKGVQMRMPYDVVIY